MRFALCTVALTAMTLGAQERQVGRGVNFYSFEREAALGAELAKDARERTTPVDNAAVRDYVDRVGGQLAAQLHNLPFPFTFAVIVDDAGGETREPLSFPGGYIFVPAKLIVTAQNEAEFAGMLAHAMAHIAERHGTRQITRIQMVHQASIPLIYSGPSGPGYNRDVLMPIALAKFQRRFEIEADTLAVQLMAGAGYDPQALVSYISRTQQDDARSPVGKASSPLPARDLRIASLREAIAALPPETYSPANDEFSRIQDEVRRLKQ